MLRFVPEFDAQTLVLDALKKKKSETELKLHINMLSYSGGSSVMFAAAGGHVCECWPKFQTWSEEAALYIVNITHGWVQKLRR